MSNPACEDDVPGIGGGGAADPPPDLRVLLCHSMLDEETLVEIVCNDQSRRWAAGQRVPVECYLTLHPLFGSGGEAAFELVYNEYALRESQGDAPTLEEYAWRFPAFADRLRRQLALHEALLPEAGPGESGASAPAWSAGASVGGLSVPGFDLLEELGRGGTGVVYKARQHGLNRLVALKVLRAGVYDDLDAVARFRAEAETSAQFQHPNLINVYEVGERDGLAYLALEYAAGGSLRDKLAGTPQDPRESARLVESLARAVHYAHLRGIVHRDLKPANVVLTDEGIAKVTDFGLAKLLEHEGGLTHTGDILGTPSYMSPEQAGGNSEAITPATDLYSLGAILYEMLSGKPPHQGRSPLSTLELVVNQEPVPPCRLVPNVPRDLETICLKCLEKDPRARYADALDLAADLRRYLDGETIHARPSSVFEKAWKWGKRRPGNALVLAVLAGTLALLAIEAAYAAGRLHDSNTRLIRAVAAARQSEQESDANRKSALEQRNLALKALNQLVFGVQERLGETAGTRPLRRSLLAVATSGLDEIARSAEASVPDLSRAVAHQKLGEVFRQIGRAADARHQLELAQRLSAQLAAAAPEDVAAADCLIKASAGLGQLALDADQYEAAQRAFERVVELAEAGLHNWPDREESRRELFTAYFQLGRTLGFEGKLTLAENWFRKTRDIAAQMAAREPGNTTAQYMLTSSTRKLADMRKLSGDLDSASASYLEAIAIARGILAGAPADLEAKFHLAMALEDLAGVAYRRHDPGRADPLYQEAERTFCELEAADPEDQLVQIHLVMVWSALGRLQRDRANHAKAAALFRRALGRLTRLDHEGRLEGRRPLTLKLSSMLREELADCSAARAALGDLDALRSRPVSEAAPLLLARTRLLRAQGRGSEALAAAAALSRLEAWSAGDRGLLARTLASCAAALDDDNWPNAPVAERRAIRSRCAERSAAATD